MRDAAKQAARAAALMCVLPSLMSFRARSRFIGADRALEGSTQLLALIPGIAGQYLRRAFLSRVLVACHESATIEFGTIFSQVAARLDEHAYVGARCHLGRVHVGRGVMIASGVHITSGARSHGIDDLSVLMRDQPGERRIVTIGAGAWIGSAAVVMADVGCNTVVGAGAVVTKSLPDGVVAAGVPARVLRHRSDARLKAV